MSERDRTQCSETHWIERAQAHGIGHMLDGHIRFAEKGFCPSAVNQCPSVIGIERERSIKEWLTRYRDRAQQRRAYNLLLIVPWRHPPLNPPPDGRAVPLRRSLEQG